MTYRPYLIIRPWGWRAEDGTNIPGIGLMYGTKVRAHLTPKEAREMADKLHDLADQTEQENN